MSERLSTQLGVAAAIVIALCAITFAEHVVAQTTCPNAGERPAVASDAVVQSGQLPVGTCYNPNATGINQSSEQAKAYLLSLPRSGSATDPSSIQSINNSFAICAATFFKAFQQQYGGTLTITSGYRSPAYDAKMCVNNPQCGALENNPNPMGNHQKGLAIDVSASVGQDTIAKFAQANPQFGVCFPFSSAFGSSFKDNVHMILAGIPGSEPSGPGCSNVKQACSAGNFNPNSIVTPPPANAAQQTPNPASSLGSTVQRLFSPPPQAVAPYAQPASIAPITTAPVTTQTGACAPQYICSNGTVYYQSASCTTSTFQMCQYGCAGTVCAPAPANGTSSQPVLNPIVASSPLGLLQQFLSPVLPTSTSTATSAPVSLNSNIYTIVQGELGSQAQATSSASSSFEGTSGYVQQTLTGNPGATTYSDTSYSPLMSAFINLRLTLSNLLTYLQPFGGQIPTPPNAE